jgi:hypothetical protein
MAEEMEEQVVAGAGAVDIGDGGIFGARVGANNRII